MARAKHPYRPTRPQFPAVGSGARGITFSDVDRAADALLREGSRPTIEKVRAKIGRGSPNTINPLLDAWWQRLAGRLDAGPAALHRIPEAVVHAAEGLWLQAVNDARQRVASETRSAKQVVAREKQDLAVQTHVLALRENELRDRIEAAERRAGQYEIEIESLVTMLRREQASRASADRRLRELGDDKSVPRARATKPAAAVATPRKPKFRKPATKAPRTRRALRRNVSKSKRSRQP